MDTSEKATKVASPVTPGDPEMYFLVPMVKYAYKILDIFFKLISWLLIIVALRFTAAQINIRSFTIFAYIVQTIYFAFLTIGTLFMFSVGRKDLGLPETNIGYFPLIVIKLIALGVIVFMTSPTMTMDAIFARMIEIKIVK